MTLIEWDLQKRKILHSLYATLQLFHYTRLRLSKIRLSFIYLTTRCQSHTHIVPVDLASTHCTVRHTNTHTHTSVHACLSLTWHVNSLHFPSLLLLVFQNPHDKPLPAFSASWATMLITEMWFVVFLGYCAPTVHSDWLSRWDCLFGGRGQAFSVTTNRQWKTDLIKEVAN